MATTLENQISLQHDLSHDTLMGLQELDQELDSHLAIFEPSDAGRDSSNQSLISIPTLEHSINNYGQSAHTIIVESPGRPNPRKYQSENDPVESRAKYADRKHMTNGIAQYVCFLLSHFMSMMSMLYPCWNDSQLINLLL
jgi:hypothetical protein